MKFILLLPWMLLFLSFSTFSNSLNCTSQTFTNNKLYKNCTDLPTLSSYLHWTYHPSNSSLSVAFVAPPAKSNGWISWAINPTATGMVGAQSLVAFKESNGSMTVKTYNITSYSSIVPSKLSFNVSDSSAEYSGGLMRIFATLGLPEDMTVVNQVWQVGGSVINRDFPAKHAFEPENLNAKGTLELVKSPSNATTGGGNGDDNGSARKKSSNGYRIQGVKTGIYVCTFIVYCWNFIFEF